LGGSAAQAVTCSRRLRSRHMATGVGDFSDCV
jgi:hypothetical protein